MENKATLKDIFEYLEKTKGIERFDFFGLREPNPSFWYEACDVPEDEYHSVSIYFTPDDAITASLADLICDVSFCKAVWDKNWYYFSVQGFTRFRTKGPQALLNHIWNTKK